MSNSNSEYELLPMHLRSTEAGSEWLWKFWIVLLTQSYMFWTTHIYAYDYDHDYAKRKASKMVWGLSLKYGWNFPTILYTTSISRNVMQYRETEGRSYIWPFFDAMIPKRLLDTRKSFWWKWRKNICMKARTGGRAVVWCGYCMVLTIALFA